MRLGGGCALRPPGVVICRALPQSEGPSNGLFRSQGPNETTRRLRDATLSMEATPEGRKVLREFQALRFVPTAVGDDEPVFEIAGGAGVDPRTYEYSER